MSEGGGLAGHSAQAETRKGVVVRSLQPAIVEAKGLRGAVLKVKLAVVVPREVLRGELARRVRVEVAKPVSGSILRNTRG